MAVADVGYPDAMTARTAPPERTDGPTSLASKVLQFNLQLARSARDVAGSATRVAGTGIRNVAETSRRAGATVVGQARSAVQRTMSTARQGRAEVAGQVEAQGDAVAASVASETHRAADRAVRAVSDTPGTGTPYEDWSREQLYERAQELGIDGRSGMSKAQLIRALRAA